MTARRKKVVLTLVLVAAAGALAWWMPGLRSGAKLELIFVGPSSPATPTHERWAYTERRPPTMVQTVRVLATNSGSVPLQVLGGLRGRNEDEAPLAPAWVEGYSRNVSTNLPCLLQPREGILLEFELRHADEPWWAELKAERRQWSDRMHPKVQGVSVVWVRRLLEKFFSRPPTVWAALGPVTNLPPSKPQPAAGP